MLIFFACNFKETNTFFLDILFALSEKNVLDIRSKKLLIYKLINVKISNYTYIDEWQWFLYRKLKAKNMSIFFAFLLRQKVLIY